MYKGDRVLTLEVNDDELLVQTAENGRQIVVTDSLKQRVLYVNHYSKLAGRPECSKL